MDDFKLTSFEGLGKIPVDILSQGSRKITDYLFDLSSSPDADPLYRSKLMVVGFENVGKTTILDCLFPCKGYMSTLGKSTLVKTRYWFALRGNKLSKFESPSDKRPYKDKVYLLENRQTEMIATSEDYGIKLIGARQLKDNKVEDIQLHCESRESFEGWSLRLRRLCFNEATHGIEIQRHEIDNEITQSYFRKIVASGKKTLEVSVWDFAGQNDYYNNHQFFLSTRTVFLVLWKISQGEEGLQGLEFWFRSLTTHLSTLQRPTPGTYYSVIVVGTFLDHPSVRKDQKTMRDQRVDELARKCELPCEVQTFEVNCNGTADIPFENVDTLFDFITQTILSHSYMGERIPRIYVTLSEHLTATRNRKGTLPIAEFSELHSKLMMDENLARRALELLSLWGECLYFNSPPELAKLVVLDPKFLAKGILADLFRHDPNIQNMRRNGVVENKDFLHIWSRYQKEQHEALPNLTFYFVALLEKLGVLFILRDDNNDDDEFDFEVANLRQRAASPSHPSFAERVEIFMSQKCILPGLLPAKEPDPLPRQPGYPSKFQQAWPEDPPLHRPLQIERVLKFNVVPTELVSRLLVHFHPYIQGDLIWKNDVVLLVKQLENTQAYIRGELDQHRFVVLIRGITLSGCKLLLNLILQLISEVVGDRSAIKFEEMICSQHYRGCELRLEQILEDTHRPLTERQLACPDTLLPLKAEELLVRAGMLEGARPTPEQSLRTQRWWGMQGKGSDYLLRLVAKDGRIHDADLFAKFTRMTVHFGGTPRKALEVYGINNPHLTSAFESHLVNLTKKHLSSGALFKRDSWRNSVEAAQRSRFVKNFGRKVQAFRNEFNDGSRAFILPVLQGTSDLGAYGVVNNGFGAVGHTDDGFYGRGMYFTSDLPYACKYAKETSLGPNIRVFVFSLILPGNPYPVTERPREPGSFLGQACKPGFQSHYTVVESKVIKFAFPTRNEEFATLKDLETADEVVIFETAQTLPLFVVIYDATELLADPSPSPTPATLGTAPNIFESLLLTPTVSLAPIEGPGEPADDSVDSTDHFERELEKIKKSYKRLESEYRRLGSLLSEKAPDLLMHGVITEMNRLREDNMKMKRELEESRAREEALQVRLHQLESVRKKSR